ncbi:MAG: hypothetical protein ACREKM_07220 [Longimicrobiales bacterium]
MADFRRREAGEPVAKSRYYVALPLWTGLVLRDERLRAILFERRA